MSSYTVATMIPGMINHDFVTSSLWEAFHEFKRIQAKGWPVLLIGNYRPGEHDQAPADMDYSQVLGRANF